jgi:four helix bundle protein
MRIARGSLQELLTQIAIAAELELLARAALHALEDQAEQTGRLLFDLIRYRTASGGQAKT